jgi:uncharacterized membrane protein YidH (DUF202 family)
MSRAQIIAAWMEDALAFAAANLTFGTSSVSTHQVITIGGWNASPQMRQRVARYLVGLRINAITAGLAVRAELTDTDEDLVEVLSNVHEIIGATATSLSADQISKHRNPWLAEGIWHLCLAAAQRRAELHPPGAVIAVSLPHPKATDHGIDLAAIYHRNGSLGLSIVETKAYPTDVAGAMHSSTVYFREIDDGGHGLRLRQLVATMRGGLPSNNQPAFSDALWKKTRCYLPNPQYEAAHGPDWATPRPSLGALVPGAANVYVMPHAIDGFTAFFETISEEMRAAANSL